MHFVFVLGQTSPRVGRQASRFPKRENWVNVLRVLNLHAGGLFQRIWYLIAMLLIGISLGVIGEEKGRKEKKQGAEARARGGKNGSGKRRAEGKIGGFHLFCNPCTNKLVVCPEACRRVSVLLLCWESLASERIERGRRLAVANLSEMLDENKEIFLVFFFYFIPQLKIEKLRDSLLRCNVTSSTSMRRKSIHLYWLVLIIRLSKLIKAPKW